MKKAVHYVVRIIAALAFKGMIVVNILSDSLPINGVTTGEVSDYYFDLFAPAGYAFAIWGLIYVLLAAFTLYLLGLFRAKGAPVDEPSLTKIAIWFTLSSVANVAWLILWHYFMPGLSLLMIVVLLLCLIRITRIILGMQLSDRERVFVRLPFNIYYGWITIANIASVTAWLVSIGFTGFGIPRQIWTVIALLLGAVIATLVMFSDRSVSYGLVFMWGYIAIIVRHLSPSELAAEYPAVVVTAAVCVIWFLIMVFSVRNANKRLREEGK